jgi:hypothetical protein
VAGLLPEALRASRGGTSPKRRKVARLAAVAPSINPLRRSASQGTVKRVAWTGPL